MDQKDDIFYIQKVNAGDTDAYKYLVDRYKKMVFGISYNIVRNKEDAEDLSQEAFINAFQSLKKFKGKSKFSTWLYRIIFNLSISKTREKTYQRTEIKDELINENELSHLNVNTVDELTISLLDSALNTLHEVDRSIINFYYKEELSIKEIHEITGLSISNVKIKLHRARQQLDKVLNSKREIVYEK
jgi:RNA polymerase sigma factor (sigma-70 family)